MSRLSVREIAAALGGDVTGPNSCNVPGPGHSRADRSLSVTIAREGRLIVHSHAGDDWKLCRDYVCGRVGLERWDSSGGKPRPIFAGVDSGPDDGNSKNKAWALKIWGQSVNPTGTIVEHYLREHRGLELSSEIAGGVVRFHGSLRFDYLRHLPGMVCLLRDIVTNEPCGIHRTFIDRQTGQKIDRKMLGIAKGAAIKLDGQENIASKLTIGEGFETVLAARLAGLCPAWAMGSTSGLQFFPVLRGLEELTLLEENDAASRKAVKSCSRRYLAARKPVNIITPNVGNDFNDVLKAAKA